MSELVDFLAVGAEIQARLRAEFSGTAADTVHVLSAADLAGVTEERQLTPALHVVLQGYRPLEDRRDGRAARIEQTWLVVAVTRNVRSVRSGEDARHEAGRLALRAMTRLMGWRPPSAASPLSLAAAPGPRFVAGALYLPLALTTDLVVRAPNS